MPNFDCRCGNFLNQDRENNTYKMETVFEWVIENRIVKEVDCPFTGLRDPNSYQIEQVHIPLRLYFI